MKKILIMNGPNLNLLGTREPEKYGTTTLADLEVMCQKQAADMGYELEFFQSNYEGALVEKIHEAGKPYKAGESAITLAPPPPATAIAALDRTSADYPPATSPNLKTASATATTLVSSLSKTASYPADVDGIRHQNIWPGLVGPELYGLAVTALTPQDPLFTQQDPIYDYCGKLVGYSATVITGDSRR